MSDEYYGMNLFGEKVDFGLKDEEEADLGEKEDDRFNIFLLTDAIGARDKRGAWVIYQKALASGMVADEIFWRVMWGVKALILAEKASGVEETGLNPFVYKKNRAFLKNWKREELEKLSARLTLGYHDARRGIGDIDSLLEKTILSI
jgi:hypothetical protein